MSSNPVASLGFTILELMVTLALAGILTSIAIPSFNASISSNRLTTITNELATALNLARSEAIKRGQQVTIKSRSGTNQVWESGWDVFVDYDYDGVYDDNGTAPPCEVGEDCLLRRFDALPTGYTLRSGTDFTCWLAYLSDGTAKGSGSGCTGSTLAFGETTPAPLTFNLCDDTQTVSRSRSMRIIASGRSRVLSAASGCP